MQLSPRLGLSATLVTALSACASAPAPKPVAPPSGPTNVALVASTPVVELSKVDAPAGLVVAGRVSRPGDLAKQLAGWVSLPFEPGMVDALEPGLSQALAFDAPVDFAIVLPEEENVAQVRPQIVVSIGLKSTEKARELLENRAGGKLVERSPGIYVAPEESNYHCAIAPALGRAPTRCVCANKSESLKQLLPYATRGLPLAEFGAADMHAELRFEPLRRKFSGALRMGRTVGVPSLLREMSLNDARFDRPLSDAAHALGDELLDLFEDLDHVGLDLQAATKPEQLDLKLTLAYRSQLSFISQATADAARRMASPNAQFFDLPADSGSASFVTATDPKRLEKQRNLVAGLVEGLLAHFDLGAPLRRDVRAAIDTLYNTASPVVAAYGPAPAATSDKATPFVPAGVSAAFGWYVVGFEAPATPYKDALKTVVRLGSDKALRQGLAQLGDHRDATDKKSKSAKAAKPAAVDKSWFKLVNKTIAGMPAGSEVMLLELNQDATKKLLNEANHSKNAKKLEQLSVEALRYLVAVVPDGNRTWILMAMDDKVLVERAQALIASGKVARLSSRSDLLALKGQVAYSTGYSSLLAVKGFLQVLLLGQGKSAKEADTLFSTLPHHGTTPMFYKSVIAGDDKSRRVEISLAVPRAVFDDVAAAVPSLMMALPN